MSADQNIWDRLAEIRCFIFDVDGVFTDGGLFVTEEGKLLRVMNVRDGYAVKRAVDAGYQVHIITGGSSKGVETRLLALGCHSVHLKIHDKLPVFQEIIKTHEVDSSTVLYMGDDVADVTCVQNAHVGCAPADACSEILQASDYTCLKEGGKGCVREVIEKVLRSQDNW